MSAVARQQAGFVLAGGGSTRMGRDKALLPHAGSTLLETVAQRVQGAAGSVTIVGSPGRYAHFGFPVIADLVEGCGPLGGIFTALSVTQADWNLVVACDMPAVTEDLLRALLDAAERAGRDILVPATSEGVEPLCAVYHRRALPAVESAIRHKHLKMQDFVSSMEAARWPVAALSLFRNINTPAQFSEFEEAR
jgi:molybdenum cofactor guanylyltransferase